MCVYMNAGRSVWLTRPRVVCAQEGQEDEDGDWQEEKKEEEKEEEDACTTQTRPCVHAAHVHASRGDRGRLARQVEVLVGRDEARSPPG